MSNREDKILALEKEVARLKRELLSLQMLGEVSSTYGRPLPIQYVTSVGVIAFKLTPMKGLSSRQVTVLEEELVKAGLLEQGGPFQYLFEPIHSQVEVFGGDLIHKIRWLTKPIDWLYLIEGMKEEGLITSKSFIGTSAALMVFEGRPVLANNLATKNSSSGKASLKMIKFKKYATAILNSST